MKVEEPILPRPAKGPCRFLICECGKIFEKLRIPKPMTRFVKRVAGLVTGRGKIMPPKISRDAVRVRGSFVIVEPRKMKPFVFYPVRFPKKRLLLYKTHEGKIIIYDDR